MFFTRLGLIEAIAGLNEMEHRGFSSAMIKGLVTSANKIERLLQKKTGSFVLQTTTQYVKTRTFIRPRLTLIF